MKPINRHLITGFTYTIPVIVLYSIALAVDQNLVSLGRTPEILFLFVIPVLTVSISNSVTPKLLIIPAAVLGYVMYEMGIGFFGGILGGLLLGYLGFILSAYWKIEKQIWLVLIGYIVIPLIAFGVSYLIMNYIVSIPILWLMDGIRSWIETIDPTKTVILVGILAFFTVVDLGGPFNKLAFTFVLEFFVDGLYHITGPAIISVAIPPLSMLALLYLSPKRIKQPANSVKRLLMVGGLFGLTESAIPIILDDPLRRHPFVILGSIGASVFAASMGLENVLLMMSLPGLFGTNMIGVYVLSHLLAIGFIVGMITIVTPQKTLNNTENTV